MSSEHKKGFLYKVEVSLALTTVGIFILFFSAIGTILIAPKYVDEAWTSVCSSYQKQMYEVADPHVYISGATGGKPELECVHHLQEGHSLIALQESELVRFIAPPSLEGYVTRLGESPLKLTSKLILLRRPLGQTQEEASEKQRELQKKWKDSYPNAAAEGKQMPYYMFYEVFEPGKKDAFSLGGPEGTTSDWVDRNFVLLEGEGGAPHHLESGVIYVKNPVEYRVTFYDFAGEPHWHYDPNGEAIKSLEELTGKALGFTSRKELIAYGEHLFTIEGCWYCHTDQTRTLVQDTVLNGSDEYPAPPSSPNEYVYQQVSFMGTRRIGPDLSRVGVKRPHRDWHKGHFWSPKTTSKGTIMPAYQHFFDDDPRGTSGDSTGVPNHKFEAIFQYLMTKGTRITPPTRAWWLGLDPVLTKEIIEGKKKVGDKT